MEYSSNDMEYCAFDEYIFVCKGADSDFGRRGRADICRKSSKNAYVLDSFCAYGLCRGFGAGDVTMGVLVRRGRAETDKDSRRSAGAMSLCGADGMLQNVLREVWRADRLAKIHGRKRYFMRGKLSDGGIDEESAAGIMRLRLVWSVGWNYVAWDVQPVFKIMPAGRDYDVCIACAGRRLGMCGRTRSGKPGIGTFPGVWTEGGTCSGDHIPYSYDRSFAVRQDKKMKL